MMFYLVTATSKGEFLPFFVVLDVTTLHRCTGSVLGWIPFHRAFLKSSLALPRIDEWLLLRITQAVTTTYQRLHCLFLFLLLAFAFVSFVPFFLCVCVCVWINVSASWIQRWSFSSRRKRSSCLVPLLYRKKEKKKKGELESVHILRKSYLFFFLHSWSKAQKRFPCFALSFCCSLWHEISRFLRPF